MFHVLPQESTLGPLLFVIYINDFTQSINLCKVVLYADDTILLFANKDPDIIKHTLETDLQSAQHWFNCKKLNLNVSKCKWMYKVSDVTLDWQNHIDVISLTFQGE